MVAYSFKSQFVVPIDLGEKQQTLRNKGKKRHALPGDTIQHYTGDRFHPRKFGEATCQEAGEITLDFRRNRVVYTTARGGVRILEKADDLAAFAKLDGFPSWADLRAFWAVTHKGQDVWTGVRIFWGDTFRAGVTAAKEGAA